MTNNKKKMNQKTVKLVYMAMFTAIIVLLTCLPIKTFGLEITLAIIPIAIGAVVLGPVAGGILGGIYGICSFLQCLGLLCPSPFGASILAIDPTLTFITCVVPRVLCGLIPGFIFKALSKFDKTKFLGHVTACLACPLLNTLFFMSSIMIFFGNSDVIQGFMEMFGVYNPLVFVFCFVGINGLVEAIACFVIATAISKALTVASSKFN